MGILAYVLGQWKHTYCLYSNHNPRTIIHHNRISTQNPTPCMFEIRHFSIAFSTHTPFFGVGCVTSDLRLSTNVGRRSDTPLCCIFDRFSFQSANQNCINRRKSDVLRPLKRQPSNGQKYRRKGNVVGIFIQRVSKIQRHLTLEESAFRRGLTL